MDGFDQSQSALLRRLNAFVEPGNFAAVLGVKFTGATFDFVEAEIPASPNHTTRPGILHGGALLAIADTLGGFATRVNLKPGQGTTTIESKTNFLRAATPGDLLKARADVLHRGRTTMVWQIRIFDGGGRCVTATTQTQLILDARREVDG